jgi:hypothetical protein
MNKHTCHEAFHLGQHLRSQHPLRSGQYKLKECRDRLWLCHAEIVRIRQHLTNKGGPSAFRHCTTEDKHLWLKDLPSHVAHRLGYEVLPGLLALNADGAASRAIMTARPHIETECRTLLNALESARILIRRNIEFEYWHMRQGASMLEPLVERAIDITDYALSVVP